MPASEKTWRDMKLMHTLFAVSGVALLVSTVWMFAQDHQREWKQHQREFRRVERQIAQWRLRHDIDANRERHAELQERMLQARSQVPDPAVIDAFLNEMRRNAEKREVAPRDAERIRERYNQLRDLARDLPASAAPAEGTAQRDGSPETPATLLVSTAQSGAEPSGEQQDAGQAGGEESAEVREARQRFAEKRGELLDLMRRAIRQARYREDLLLNQRKFKAADVDAAKADRGLAIRDGILTQPNGQERLDQIDQGIEQLEQELHELTLEYQEASQHRQNLQDQLAAITADEDGVQKELDALNLDHSRLQQAVVDRTSTYFTASPPFLGKKWLELPILDAFNSPLKIDNLWTEGLTIQNGSFGRVRRFDRCTTCHRAIQQTQPGSATEPAYRQEHDLVIEIQLPEEAPADAQGNPLPLTLENVYGVELASHGLIDYDDVTVEHVAPRTPAAMGRPRDIAADSPDAPYGIQAGDVLLAVGEDSILSAEMARQYLLHNIRWGGTVRVRVRRGLPHPYATHPRLDLFVGSLSPHGIDTFGCTVCHEGQGSATAFKWASHSPDSPAERRQWREEYGWFNNHHWIFPMFPRRFAESACLKCHHNVVELRPSQRFPEPPAPKLMEGYDLILANGCFGCHEINGFKGADERLGPDLRLEPNYYAVAAQLTQDPGLEKLGPQVLDWARELIHHPEHDGARRRLMEAINQDAASDLPVLTPESHALAGALGDVETPGELRKVGPSLRHVGEKVGAQFLFDWLMDPTHFRPSTRMPKFFGNHSHLTDAEKELVQRFEQIESLGIVTYLLDRSQELELPQADQYLPDPEDEAMVERGKLLFETRGCLACHSHRDFPAGTADFGPDLSNVGDKFALPDTPDARRWLFAWLKDPSQYHPRTRMPDTFLDPIAGADGTTTDPAADVAAYLLSSRSDWQPVDNAALAAEAVADPNWRAPEPVREALHELAFEHLRKAFIESDARRFLEQGIPESRAARLKGAERELVGEPTTRKLLNYIGSKSISKYGCYGCHDIPGFEDAKPIGTALADWGRKEPEKLAFEHIAEYLEHGHGHAEAAEPAGTDPFAVTEHFDESFYQLQILEHDRSGFIWQKLKEPRSYDYQKYGADRATYNDRLRMPKFALTPNQREAVITFVLGLVADPPASQFVYHPTPRQEALVEGTKVLEKFNCQGCHMLEPETWRIEFEPGAFGPQPTNDAVEYPFLRSHFPVDQVLASAQPDEKTGLVTAVLRGVPHITDDEAKPMVLDEEGLPLEPDMEYDPETLEFLFQLWEPTLIEGAVYEAGVMPLQIPKRMIRQQRPARGGDLTRLLLPRVVELEQDVNPAAKGGEAWGWLPPPLVGQGKKVRPDWLHDFLLDPHPIRPAVFLRMPKFNMSSAEASALVNYFAARDRAEYPYQFDDRTRSEHLDEQEVAYQQTLQEVPSQERPAGETRFDHAMNIVVDQNYCIKCHLVGDFIPEGSPRALAPDLSDIHTRLQVDYVRRWIANPKRILPYTPMPVNIPYNAADPHLGGVSQQLYHGTSVQQLDALVDLLMNYPRFAAQRVKIAPLVEQAKTQSAPAAAGGGS